MYSPAEVARRYVETGKSKAALPVGRMLLLGMLAGAFIALAGGSATFAVSYGGRLAGAAVFPAGLAMVLLAGSELFTGNCLLVIPLLERQLTWGRMLRSWGIVYLANVLGAGLVAALTVAAGTFDGVYESVVATAAAKAGLPFLTALLRGVLCNFLVCIAVWMSLAAQSVPGKLAGTRSYSQVWRALVSSIHALTARFSSRTPVTRAVFGPRARRRLRRLVNAEVVRGWLEQGVFVRRAASVRLGVMRSAPAASSPIRRHISGV